MTTRQQTETPAVTDDGAAEFYRDLAADQAEEIEGLREQLAEAQQDPEGTEGAPESEAVPGSDRYDQRFGPRSPWARDLERAKALDDRARMKALFDERDMWVETHQASQAAARIREAQAAEVAELPLVKELDEARAEALREGDLAEAHRLAQERPMVVDRAKAEAEGHADVAAATDQIIRGWAREGRLPDGTRIDEADGRIQELLAEKEDLGTGGLERNMAQADLDDQIMARRLEIAQAYAEADPDLGGAQPAQSPEPSEAEIDGQTVPVVEPQNPHKAYEAAERRGDLPEMIRLQNVIARQWYEGRQEAR